MIRRPRLRFAAGKRLLVWDVATGRTRPAPDVGDTGAWVYELDPSGTRVAWGGRDGLVHVMSLADGTSRLLAGHLGQVHTVRISPDGRWIASAGEDNTIRLWPMPDVSQPGLESMPLPPLLTNLRSLTNLRVVRAADTPDGWKIALDRFPGWSDVPTSNP